MFDNDTATALNVLSKAHRNRFRGLLTGHGFLDGIEDDGLLDLLYDNDELTLNAWANVIEGGEFSADDIVDIMCRLVDIAYDRGWNAGKQAGEYLAGRKSPESDES